MVPRSWALALCGGILVLGVAHAYVPCGRAVLSVPAGRFCGGPAPRSRPGCARRRAPWQIGGACGLHAGTIKDITARQILDSRGNPTIEVDLSTEDGTFRASVPSGASTGQYEALELRDGDAARFCGKGVSRAIENVHSKLLPGVLGMDTREQDALDARLLEIDGTPDKSALGANALLAVSLAACRAGAASQGLPLYRHISDLVKGQGLEEAGWEARGRGKLLLPVPWLNVINGCA